MNCTRSVVLLRVGKIVNAKIINAKILGVQSAFYKFESSPRFSSPVQSAFYHMPSQKLQPFALKSDLFLNLHDSALNKLIPRVCSNPSSITATCIEMLISSGCYANQYRVAVFETPCIVNTHAYVLCMNTVI